MTNIQEKIMLVHFYYNKASSTSSVLVTLISIGDEPPVEAVVDGLVGSIVYFLELLFVPARSNLFHNFYIDHTAIP